ncbi:MAG: FTR1 family protein, partial [Propionibacteriaceae bacterium]|nr:FTR1 family protein [Propionibacteriaceae bacterium]
MLVRPRLTVGAARALAMGIIAFIALLLGSYTAHAAPQTWGDVAEDMATVLTDAGQTYLQGDAEAGIEGVNNAYYGYYEKAGFEKTVMAYISGGRATEVEYLFSTIKKQMSAGAPAAEVTASLDELAQMLRADALTLDGDKSDPLSEFLGSLTIILREGFEAILVVGAIVAYLVKSGNTASNRYVYIGVGVALLASV